MSNMSYCRFQNTLSDLQDCEEALDEIVGGPDNDISAEEARAAVQLIETCVRIAQMSAELREHLTNNDG